MKATPEIEAQGLRAYERVHAYEHLRKWRLPLTYFACILVPLVCGSTFWWQSHPYWALSQVFFALFFVACIYFHSRKLATEYAANQTILADLRKTYGDDLPWVRMEKHFDELRQLEAEIAQERASKTLSLIHI